MGIFTYLLIPETKNTPIEDIECRYINHWFWGKVLARANAQSGAASCTAMTQPETLCKVEVAREPMASK
eukprot:gene13343-13471_t